MSVADRSLYFKGGRTGLLLIHGLGGTPIELRFVAVRLAKAGHTVYCPQLAGHCGSYEDLRGTGWRDWYASVGKAHERLSQECDTIIVGGLSMGAVLALHLAAERPTHVHGLALFAPTLWLDGWGIPWRQRLFALVTQKWCADLFPFAERDPYGIKDVRVRALVIAAIQSGDSSQAGCLSSPGSSMLELRWLVNAVRRELGRIRQPTLILHPRHDDRASLKNAIHLQERLGGRVETVVLDDSYHVITLDRQREIVAEQTDRFARAIASASRAHPSSESRPQPEANGSPYPTDGPVSPGLRTV